MSAFSGVYQGKAEALRLVVESLGQTMDQVLERYRDVRFPNTRLEKRKVFLEVIDLDPAAKTLEYLDEQCGSLSHFRDRRSGPEYAADLILGWLVEDAVLRHISGTKGGAILAGHDRFREFLPAKKISTQPDILLTTKDGPRLLEVFADWTGHWRKVGEMDLRDGKFDRLVQEEALMLCLAPRSQEGFVIDFRTEVPAFQEKVNARYGGKWVHQLDGVRERFRPANEALAAIERMLVASP